MPLRSLLLLALALPLPALAGAQSRRAAAPVVYHVSFPNAVHHEAEVRLTLTGLPARPVQLRMSRSSPGRYALHEFAKNAYSVKAVNSKGRALRVTRPNPHQWDVAGHDGTVVVTYTLFGDRADGTYSAIDLTHAHLNMPATFMWARGLDARPVRVTFRTDRPWKVATQLFPTPDSLTFTAPVAFGSGIVANPLVNTVTVSDPANPEPVLATDSNARSSQVSLAVVKTDGSASYTPGGAATYTVTVTNGGVSDATNVTVSDTLPAGVTLTSNVTCVGNGGAVSPCIKMFVTISST